MVISACDQLQSPVSTSCACVSCEHASARSSTQTGTAHWPIATKFRTRTVAALSPTTERAKFFSEVPSCLAVHPYTYGECVHDHVLLIEQVADAAVALRGELRCKLRSGFYGLEKVGDRCLVEQQTQIVGRICRCMIGAADGAYGISNGSSPGGVVVGCAALHGGACRVPASGHGGSAFPRAVSDLQRSAATCQFSCGRSRLGALFDTFVDRGLRTTSAKQCVELLAVDRTQVRDEHITCRGEECQRCLVSVGRHLKSTEKLCDGLLCIPDRVRPALVEPAMLQVLYTAVV